MIAYLDANFFIFAIVDPTPKGDAARKMMREIFSGKVSGVTSTLCLDELMWAMIRNDLAGRMRAQIEDIYRIPNLKIVAGSPTLPLRALEFIEGYNLKPRDAFHAAFMKEQNISIIVSDDKDFDRIRGIKRVWKQ